MSEWYGRIEPGIRPIVKLLRDNGINTTGSCEHTMVVWATWIDDDEPDRIAALLSERGYQFAIDAHIYRGRCNGSRDITITIHGRFPCHHTFASPELIRIEPEPERELSELEKLERQNYELRERLREASGGAGRHNR